MNIGLKYVEEKYGVEAVKEYLRQFATAYYTPLKKEIIQSGLSAVESYIRNIYEKEEWADHVLLERNKDNLIVKIEKCPAVAHILGAGDKLYSHYMETTKTVYETICEGMGVDFMLLKYDEISGAAELSFSIGKERV